MQYQKSIVEDQLSIQYPVDTVQLDGKKYIKVKDYMYDINMQLGKGSYGTVYLGYAIEQGKDMNDLMKVAIKKITIPSSAQQKQQINRILKNTQSQLFALMSFSNNMHILRLYDFVRSEEEGAVYQVLEYCNQKDLQNYLKSQRKKYTLCELEIRYYFMQILKGFKDLHSKMFLHRDIKPQNILVSNGVIKIADFGFAQKFNEFGQKRVTFAGTPQTAAPQIILHIPYTDKCDIYSLGVILYWMIYQKYPIREIITQQDYLKPLVFPSSPQVDIKMKQLIIDMLKFEQNQRIDWQTLFDHSLFNEQIILQTFKIKPQTPKPLSYADRVSSLRYTTKKNRINDAVPSRASLWLAGLINKQYEIDQSLQKYELNLRTHLKFQTGKVQVLKMISQTVKNYTLQKSNILSLKQSQLKLLKDIIYYALEEIITSSLRKIKKQICLQTPLQIFNYEDIDAINHTENYFSITQQITQTFKIQQTKHKSYSNDVSQRLSTQVQKYKLDEVVNWVLRPYNLHPKKFQNQLKRIIIQFICILKPQIISSEIRPPRQTIILVHQLFIFMMRQQIFKKQNYNKISFNYFFQKENRNTSTEGFQYLFIQVRQLVQTFKPK